MLLSIIHSYVVHDFNNIHVDYVQIVQHNLIQAVKDGNIEASG